MCKEDVRIGRAKQTNAGVSTFVDNTNSKLLLTANPNRAGAVITQNVVDPTGLANPIYVRAGSAAGPIVGALNQYRPQLNLTVEEHGNGCTSALWATTDDTGGATVTSAEFSWIKGLDEL